MTDEQGPGASFEERLRQAQIRRDAASGVEPVAAVDLDAKNGSLVGVGLRVGIELVSALAVAVAIGWGLDHWLHTLPLFLIVFILIGGAAGVVNVWRIVGPAKGTKRTAGKRSA
jgi:ATP synthase protein I